MEDEGLPVIMDDQPLDQEAYELLVAQWLDPAVEADDVMDDHQEEEEVLHVEEDDDALLEVPPANERTLRIVQGDVAGTHSPSTLQRLILLQISSDVPYRQIFNSLHLLQGLPMPIIRMIDYMHDVICRDYVVEMFIYVGFLPDDHPARICGFCAIALNAYDEDLHIFNWYIRMQSIIPFTTDIRFMLRCDRCTRTLVTNVLACHCRNRN